MKKTNLIVIGLFIGHSWNSFILTKSQNELGSGLLVRNIDYTANIKKSKLKRTNPLEFQPDNAFGGPQAQGKYDYKLKTATIDYEGRTYYFKLVAELPNPDNDTLVRFGSFINGITRGMPITRYLFGELVENE